MTIRLNHTHDHKWIVIVNSIGGSVNLDITKEVRDAMMTEIWEEAQKRADAELKQKVKEMREAIDGCIHSLSDFIEQ